MTDLDKLEKTAKAALAFQPQPPSDGWPDEPETAPAWDATSGWLEDGGHAAFARNHEYSDDQESDGADVDAAYIKAADPATVIALVAEARELRRMKSALEYVAARRVLVGSDLAKEVLEQAEAFGGTCTCSWRSATATTVDGKWPPPHEPSCPLAAVFQQPGARCVVEKAIAGSKKIGTWDELLGSPGAPKADEK